MSNGYMHDRSSLADWAEAAQRASERSHDRRHVTRRRTRWSVALRGALVFLAAVGCVVLIANQVA